MAVSRSSPSLLKRRRSRGEWQSVEMIYHVMYTLPLPAGAIDGVSSEVRELMMKKVKDFT